MSAARHFLLTLRPDPETQAWFNRRRQEHFPRHKNHLQAHITLLHRINTTAANACSLLEPFIAAPVLSIRVSALQRTAGGNAYILESDQLQQLHIRLQQYFDPYLIPRDKRILQPHITVQNSVTEFKAQRSYLQLTAEFRSFDFSAAGLDLWEYRKGPWLRIKGFDFL